MMLSLSLALALALEAACPAVVPEQAYLEARDAETGAVIARLALCAPNVAAVEARQDEVLPGPDLYIGFDEASGRSLAELTQVHVGEPLYLVLGGIVVSSPIVREPITGNELVISGDSEPDELARLVAAMQQPCVMEESY